MLSIKDFFTKGKKVKAERGAEQSAPDIGNIDITYITQDDTADDTDELNLVPAFVLRDEYSEFF